MFPVHDDVRSTHFPWVNVAIIGLCSWVFGLQLLKGPAGNVFVERWGLVPARLVHPEETIEVEATGVVATIFGPQVVNGYRPLPPAAISDWATILSCIFLHGGWLHFLGNMWFLYLFGAKVEDRLGPVLYASLYLGSGIVAGVTHLVSDLASTVPTIGASGAIAGVMGAYLLLFPRARVTAIIPLVVLFPMIVVPAWIFLGFWIVIQFMQGAFSILDVEAGGVAWWAHIGGFVAGFLVVYSLRAVNPESEAFASKVETEEEPFDAI